MERIFLIEWKTDYGTSASSDINKEKSSIDVKQNV